MVLVAAVLVGVVAYLVATSGDEAGPRVRDDTDLRAGATGDGLAGRPAPDFVATTLDGESFDLGDLHGQPYIVNFWASWCLPCRAEFEILREVHDEEGIEVVGVVFDDIPADARRFASERDATWPSVLDAQGDIARSWGVRAIPRTYFVDAGGTIVVDAYGFTSESFRDHLEELRAAA